MNLTKAFELFVFIASVGLLLSAFFPYSLAPLAMYCWWYYSK